jgi:8-oxo-dGTP diphosphatase
MQIGVAARHHRATMSGIGRAEVREETGLTVKAGRLLKVCSGFRYRIEIYYEAVLVGGLDGLDLDAKEVLEARLFSLSDLPAGMPQAHRELAMGL